MNKCLDSLNAFLTTTQQVVRIVTFPLLSHIRAITSSLSESTTYRRNRSECPTPSSKCSTPAPWTSSPTPIASSPQSRRFASSTSRATPSSSATSTATAPSTASSTDSWRRSSIRYLFLVSLTPLQNADGEMVSSVTVSSTQQLLAGVSLLGGLHLAANCLSGHVTPALLSHAGERPFRRLPAAALPPFFAGSDGVARNGEFVSRRFIGR